MKTIIILIIIAVAGLLGYNYVTTGTVTLIPGKALSGEAQEVKDLADSFHSARRMVKQAQRSAVVGGVAGVDMVEDDMREIERIEAELDALIDSLESDDALQAAEQLEYEIEQFKRGR